ncbi:MAG: hypothetical protein AAFP04_16330 [Myxococcota bacterium]
MRCSLAFGLVSILLAADTAAAYDSLRPDELPHRPEWRLAIDLTPTLKTLDPGRKHGLTTLTSTNKLDRRQVKKLARLLLHYRAEFFDFIARDNCDDEGALHIYLVPTNTLNDPRNFPVVAKNDRTLYGVYRPLNRTLYLTPRILFNGHGFGLAHELAHHYYHVCGLQQREPQEHLRVRTFEHLIQRHKRAHWVTERLVSSGLELPGAGAVKWPILIQSSARLSRVQTERLAGTVRDAVSRYIVLHRERLSCRDPRPLTLRLVPWRGFATRGPGAPRVGGHYFSDLSELYLPQQAIPSSHILAREAAWIVHFHCRSSFRPTTQSIETFAANYSSP